MLNILKSALSSIFNNKARSFLTVLGVVIGVTSVTTLVSLGQGLKKDVTNLIQGLGTNVMAVISGKIDTENPNSQSTNPAQFVAGDILTLDDVKSVEKVKGVEIALPMSLVPSILANQDKTASPMVIGTVAKFLDAVDILEVDEGRMFSDSASDEIVIAKNAKKSLFPDSFKINDQIKVGQDDFKVVGVFAEPKTTSVFGSDFKNMALIPFDAATRLNKDQVKIFRIIAKADGDADVKKVKSEIKKAILKNHNNTEDFTVLTQDDILDVFGQFLNLATAMVSAIAAISLIVGGIGIMNIMLVTVTERTKEIGLRKAVGASRRAILIQFLIEAILITLLGGLIGLVITLIISQIIQQQTPLKPDLSLNVILIAIGISTVIGVIFGLWPALRAANKDPIEALRYE